MSTEFQILGECKCLLYRSRREYLHDHDDKPLNSLEPPIDFKNRKQASKSILLQSSYESDSDDSSPSDKNTINQNETTKKEVRKSVRTVRKIKPRTLKKTTARLEDWKHETQAGCSFWVNKHTGKVFQ